MNSSALKGKIREYNLRQQDLAQKIGLSMSRFNAKLNEYEGAEFTLSEVRAMKRILKLNEQDTERIFFAE